MVRFGRFLGLALFLAQGCAWAELNQIGTNFDLGDEEVDVLLQTSREVLRDSPEFRRLLSSIALAR